CEMLSLYITFRSFNLLCLVKLTLFMPLSLLRLLNFIANMLSCIIKVSLNDSLCTLWRVNPMVYMTFLNKVVEIRMLARSLRVIKYGQLNLHLVRNDVLDVYRNWVVLSNALLNFS